MRAETKNYTTILFTSFRRMPSLRIEWLAHPVAENRDPVLRYPVFQIEVFKNVPRPVKTKLQIVLTILVSLFSRLVVGMSFNDDFLPGLLGFQHPGNLIKNRHLFALELRIA